MPFPANVPPEWRAYVESLELAAQDQANMLDGARIANVLLSALVIFLFWALLRERPKKAVDETAWTPVQRLSAGFVQMLNVALRHGPDAMHQFRVLGNQCGGVVFDDVILISSVRSPMAQMRGHDDLGFRQRVMDDVSNGDGVAIRLMYLQEVSGAVPNAMRMTKAEFENWRAGRPAHAEV